MNTELLMQSGLSEVQAKIYLFLVKNGQSTPTEISNGINEKRTTIYSALKKLEALDIIIKKDRGKISAYIPGHPSVLESLAEKRLRKAARQAKNLEANLPSLINYYNEHQSTPGTATFYGEEGVKIIWDKVLSEKKPYYFIRSRHDNDAPYTKDLLADFRIARVKAGIKSENITPSEFNDNTPDSVNSWALERTFLPPGDYDSPVEIDIFGDNVAFINFNKNGMSTLIESPEIAEAMRQFFLFSKKYIRKSTSQDDLIKDIIERVEKSKKK